MQRNLRVSSECIERNSMLNNLFCGWIAIYFAYNLIRSVRDVISEEKKYYYVRIVRWFCQCVCGCVCWGRCLCVFVFVLLSKLFCIRKSTTISSRFISKSSPFARRYECDCLCECVRECNCYVRSCLFIGESNWKTSPRFYSILNAKFNLKCDLFVAQFMRLCQKI